MDHHCKNANGPAFCTEWHCPCRFEAIEWIFVTCCRFKNEIFVRNGLSAVKRQMNVENLRRCWRTLDEMCRSHVFRMWKCHSGRKWRARFCWVFCVAQRFAWERSLKGSTGGEDGFYPWRVDYAVSSRLANVGPFLIPHGSSIIHGVP